MHRQAGKYDNSRLYRDFPTPEALAATTPEVVYEYIRSVSYPNNKAKHLVGMAQMLVKDFNSQVPDTTGKARETSRCGTQNGKCNPVGRLQ